MRWRSMSSMFDEQPSLLRNRNSHLIMQSGESNYAKRSPLIEEEPPAQAPRAPRQVSGTAFAAALTRKQDFRAKPEGWKMFSPSTWGFLRNTAWGRKKAARRQINSLTAKVDKFGAAMKGISPRGGLFGNANWNDTGTGTPYTAATAKDDPNLTTSASYGVTSRAAGAWGTAASAIADWHRHGQGTEESKGAMKRFLGASEDSGMSRESFNALANGRNKIAGPAEPMEDLHEVGDNVDGHAWLDEPGQDAQDTGQGIPDIVQEVLGAKPGGNDSGDHLSPEVPANPVNRQSIDDSDLDEDNDDEDAFYRGNFTQEQIDAATRQMQKRW